MRKKELEQLDHNCWFDHFSQLIAFDFYYSYFQKKTIENMEKKKKILHRFIFFFLFGSLFVYFFSNSKKRGEMSWAGVWVLENLKILIEIRCIIHVFKPKYLFI